ncbi:MAG TPA: hypothetical protein VKA60_15265 [Blastocatellia bacterium]|nr:hypothetical protein [Blastocatellia bacterium]
MQEYYIWIEAEQWTPGEWNPIDCNSDVMVSFREGAEWTATFFTYANISTLVEKNGKSGECMYGKYFWATDMILVDEITRERIEEVVKHLIETGGFESIFRMSA